MKKFACIFILLTFLSAILIVFASCGDECEHQWNEGYVVEQPTDTKVGQKLFTCNLCGETRSEEVPKLTHAKHTFTKSQWAGDDKNHWMVCDFDGCEATTVKGTHLYYKAADGGLICTVCQIKNDTHSFTGKMSYDVNCHWTVCDHDNCPVTFSKLPHFLDNTGKCEACGFVAVHEAHTYTEWDITKDTHRLLCNYEGCGASTDKIAHIWITENDVEICRACRMEKSK